VTNLEVDATALYERLCCSRGEAGNGIKEVQLDLFGTRASCQRFAANRLRVLLAALATAAALRVRLLKINAAIVRNTRRVRILLASQHPVRAVFLHAARALARSRYRVLSPAR
jgi:hypothetical protein